MTRSWCAAPDSRDRPEVAASEWIEVRPIRNIAALKDALHEFGLGTGETSAIILELAINATLALIDKVRARQVARLRGLAVLGCVGVLQDAFGRRLVPDLAQLYRQLLLSGAYIDRRILDNSLSALRLPPL